MVFRYEFSSFSIHSNPAIIPSFGKRKGLGKINSVIFLFLKQVTKKDFYKSPGIPVF